MKMDEKVRVMGEQHCGVNTALEVAAGRRYLLTPLATIEALRGSHDRLDNPMCRKDLYSR